MNKKKYQGQALAIVMIVLVISIILGMAMLSRTLRDNFRVVSEKSSAEALETTDSIIDAVKGTDIAKIKETCEKPEFGGSGIDSPEGCKISGLDDVQAFIADLGISSDTTKSLSNCSEGSSDVQITTSLTGSDDEYEIRSDNVRSFVLRGQIPNPPTCSLNLVVESRGQAVGGMLITKVYGRNYVNGIATEVKAYELNDTLAYCVYNSGGDCSANPNLTDSFSPVASGSTLTIPLTAVSGYNLDEIRVRAVNSIIAVRSSYSDSACVENTEMIKMTVGANCSGAYRAKEILVPQKEWALPLFDYVVFNGSGVLQSQ